MNDFYATITLLTVLLSQHEFVLEFAKTDAEKKLHQKYIDAYSTAIELLKNEFQD